MLKIINGKGTGKTAELIAIAFKYGAIMVCEDPRTMLERIHYNGYQGVKCISYQDYIDLLLSRRVSDEKFVIDEIEKYLKIASKDLELLAFTIDAL